VFSEISNFYYRTFKRVGRVGAKNFEELKAVFGFRYVTCGSQEGKPHLLEPDKRTELQKGHMNPYKFLTLDNIIPQCQLCNRLYKDNFVFNEKERIVTVAFCRTNKKI
jgi:hypothetical protein